MCHVNIRVSYYSVLPEIKWFSTTQHICLDSLSNSISMHRQCFVITQLYSNKVHETLHTQLSVIRTSYVLVCHLVKEELKTFNLNEN
jgi:hypothetical protein